MSPFFSKNSHGSGAYSELCQTLKMELVTKVDNIFKPLTIFAKRSILDIWQGSDYVSENVFTDQ